MKAIKGLAGRSTPPASSLLLKDPPMQSPISPAITQQPQQIPYQAPPPVTPLTSLQQQKISNSGRKSGFFRKLWADTSSPSTTTSYSGSNNKLSDFQSAGDEEGDIQIYPLSTDDLKSLLFENQSAAMTISRTHLIRNSDNDSFSSSRDILRSEPVAAPELEGFCLTTAMNELETNPIFDFLARSEMAPVLLPSICHLIFKTIAWSFMFAPPTPLSPNSTLVNDNQAESDSILYDGELVKRFIQSRIYGITNEVIRRRKRIISNANCVVGEISCCSEIGHRENNEDQHFTCQFVCELTGLCDTPSTTSTASLLQQPQPFQSPIIAAKMPCSIFGVFDGHGGPGCAQFISRHLFVNLARHPALERDPRLALRDSFMYTNQRWAVKVAKDDLSHTCGSTAVVALFLHKTIHIAWAGDSSAVLFLRDGVYLDFVFPHKPTFDNERMRIEQMGGFVANDRVNGALAVSRSFGDLKYGCVNPDPDFMDYTLTGNELFLILACDGLTDVMDPNEIYAFIQGLTRGNQNTSSKEISQALAKEAIRRGSMDNVTVVYISLREPFKVSPTALNADMPLINIPQNSASSLTRSGTDTTLARTAPKSRDTTLQEISKHITRSSSTIVPDNSTT